MEAWPAEMEDMEKWFLPVWKECAGAGIGNRDVNRVRTLNSTGNETPEH